MEIVREGISPKNWSKEVKCPYCSRILKISADDISMRTTANRNNFWGEKRLTTFFETKCKCGTIFKVKGIPQPIADYLRNKRRGSMDYWMDFFFCYFS